MAQFERVNTSRGAPMGRRNDAYLETDQPRFVRLFRVNLDRGGYDDGGAYWGYDRVGSLYCAIDDDGNQQFIRTVSRRRAALLLGIPATALKFPLKEWAHWACALLDGRAPMPEGVTREDLIDWMQRSGAKMGQPC